ncbi:MAG TPA: pyridoxal kinase [Hyphomicrobiaceae bacterium]|nr:pyridoxal kinase [Hyphomicrobiaceae bacterium]
MARILAISSYVASGHVGLSAIVPALQALGHEVVAVPTVVLSCHYGHAHVGGIAVDMTGLDSLFSALRANGILDEIDAILTGYMPEAAAVARVAEELERIAQNRPDALYLCDPVLGDDPRGLYVPDDVAGAIRDSLLPRADIVTPNRFELSWLSGLEVGNSVDADRAADATGAEFLAITSVPAGNGLVANVSSDGDDALMCAAPLLNHVPHGTGDLFAALLLGHILNGHDHAEAMARASAGVQLVIGESVGARELRLVSSLGRAVAVEPAELVPVFDD